MGASLKTNFSDAGALASRAAASLGSQILVSLSNFVLAWLVLRTSTKADYALYVQATSLIFFVSIFQNGLLVAPAVTHLAREQCANVRAGIAATALRFNIGAAALGALVLGGAGMLALRHIGVIDGSMALALAVAGGAFWLRDFARNVEFANGTHLNAFILDLGYALVVSVIAGVLFAVSATSVAAMLATSGIAGLLAWGVWLWLSPEFRRMRVGDSGRQSALDMRLGKWEVATGTLSWAASHGWVWAAALLLPATSVAEIAAARLLASPLTMMWPAINNFLRARLGQGAAERGENGNYVLVWRSQKVVVLISAITLIFAELIGPELFRYLLGGGYERSSALVLFWLTLVGIGGASSILAGALRARLDFRAVTISNGVAVLCGMFCMVLCHRFFSSSVAFWSGLFAAEVGLLIVLRAFWVWHR